MAGQDRWDRTTKTERPRQNSTVDPGEVRAGHIGLTGQPGQNRVREGGRHRSKNWFSGLDSRKIDRAVRTLQQGQDRRAEEEVLGQEQLERTLGAEHHGGQP
jgi:hypothetical protein